MNGIKACLLDKLLVNERAHTLGVLLSEWNTDPFARQSIKVMYKSSVRITFASVIDYCGGPLLRNLTQRIKRMLKND